MTADELVLEIDSCPAVAHLRTNDLPVARLFSETSRTVNEALCEGTPFAAELVSYRESDGQERPALLQEGLVISCTEFIPAYSELFKFLYAQGGRQAVLDFWICHSERNEEFPPRQTDSSLEACCDGCCAGHPLRMTGNCNLSYRLLRLPP